MEDKTAAQLTEQLQHANHLLQAQIKALEGKVGHLQAMNEQRLAALEEQARDHETRIRLRRKASPSSSCSRGWLPAGQA